MTRLYVLVEGQTEERIASALLAEHLRSHGVESAFIAVETARAAHGKKHAGGGSWSTWKRNFERLKAQHPGNDVRFSSWFDLFRLPKDFPGLDRHGNDKDTVRRAEKLEASMADAIGDWRFVPYLQRHEVEALVLASLDSLSSLLDPSERDAVDALREALGSLRPEDVNDGPETAPSRRLEAHIKEYRKVLHGPLAIEGHGLAGVRAACPRFDAWVGRLEKLGARAAG